jgi:invasion protein IalB
MSVRKLANLLALSFVAATAAATAAEPAPAAPAAAPAAEAAPAPAQPAPPAGAPQPANQFSVNQAVGDWAVRCALTTVKSPAPCDIVQVAVNQDSKLRVMSFSLAYVPSRDAYAMQVVVPTGVALSRGLTLAAGNRSLNGAKFNRCERDGCYVEMLIDNPTVTALGGAGKSTSISVVAYGKTDPFQLPVSLNGFTDALERMKGLSRERAVALPAGTPTPTPVSATPNPAPAPAAAAPARAGRAAPARAGR